MRSQIVSAAAALLRGQGTAAVTTRAVAQAANVPAPTIYRLFGDKDGLIDAVAEQVMADYVAEKAADVEHNVPSDPVDGLRAGWRQHIEFGLANADVFLLLNAPHRIGRSPAGRAGEVVLRERVHRLAAAGMLRVEETRAVAMLHAAGTGVIMTLLGVAPNERDLSLADDMFDTVLAAITTQRPFLAESGAVPIAVAFATVVPELAGLSPNERALMGDWVTRAIERSGHR
jgi:AcrR family transcriptional regulator